MGIEGIIDIPAVYIYIGHYVPTLVTLNWNTPLGSSLSRIVISQISSPGLLSIGNPLDTEEFTKRTSVMFNRKLSFNSGILSYNERDNN